MNDEEQKAIDIVEDIAFSRGIRQDVDGKLEDLKAIKDVFRLVDKKQKEIELYIENNAKIKELNEEEIKAIEELKEEINKPIEVPEDKFNTFILYNIKNAKIILSIVENQQKEIERLNSIINTDNIINKERAELIEQQRKELEELKGRLSIRKEQQNSILTEKIKTLREEKIELIHNFEEKEKISKKEIKSLLKEIEELNAEILELTNQITDGFWKNDRLKKKIEKLKGIHQEFLKLHQGLNAEGTLLSADNILNAIEKKYISKDKIKKILGIEEDEEDNEEKILSLLQTIVDECYRLEDVEDRKVQVEVDNIEKKRDKYWKDKIRNLKEEIRGRLHIVTEDSPMYEKISEFKDEGAYNILEELLKE